MACPPLAIRAFISVGCRSFSAVRAGTRRPWRPTTFCRPQSSMSSPSSNDSDGVPSLEYQMIEGVEWLEQYRPGGYHPVLIGDTLHDRYRIIHKVGHGTFATIWLARDMQRAVYVAVKVGTEVSHSREAHNLRGIADSTPSKSYSQGQGLIPIVHDGFEIQGPNGKHRCYAMEPAQSSVSAANFTHLFKIDAARALAAQLALAVAYIQERGFVHGDIHLGNALLQLPLNFNILSVDQLYETFGQPHLEPVVRLDGKPLPPGVPPRAVLPVRLGKKANEISLSEARLLLSDFGESFAPSRERRIGDECHAPLAVMPPEAYFEPDGAISFPSDIWTLACAIWSLLTPKPLFQAMLASAHDIVSRQVDKLGPLPSEWWDQWEERGAYFDEMGRPEEGRYVFAPLERSFEEDLQRYRRQDNVGELSKEETQTILDMFRSMLKFRPSERATVEQVLKSDWMTKWALPEFHRISDGKL